MMRNANSMLAASAALVVATAIVRTSPDSNFILSPGFVRRTETGSIHYEEYKFYEHENCKKHIYHSQKPNHILTLTDNFNISIKIAIEAESPNPTIIIRPAKILENAIPICQDLNHKLSEVLLTYSHKSFEDIVPAGTYLIWVGNTTRNNSATNYKIVVTEEKGFR